MTTQEKEAALKAMRIITGALEQSGSVQPNAAGIKVIPLVAVEGVFTAMLDLLPTTSPATDHA